MSKFVSSFKFEDRDFKNEKEKNKYIEMAYNTFCVMCINQMKNTHNFKMDFGMVYDNSQKKDIHSVIFSIDKPLKDVMIERRKIRTAKNKEIEKEIKKENTNLQPKLTQNNIKHNAVIDGKEVNIKIEKNKKEEV